MSLFSQKLTATLLISPTATHKKSEQTLQTLQCLARQRIPIRENDDHQSNFIHPLNLSVKVDSVLESWLKDEEVPYTIHDIQNEIIALMEKEVIMQRLSGQNKKNFFSIM